MTHPILGLASPPSTTWAKTLVTNEEDVELGLDLAIEELARGMLGAETWVDPDGYLLSTDHRLAFLFIQQTESTDSASFIVPFMADVRNKVAVTLADYPGVTVGFTGWPAAIEEDYMLLMNDLPRVSLLATCSSWLSSWPLSVHSTARCWSSCRLDAGSYGHWD